MEHYWQDLPGPIWFFGANLYRRYVSGVTAPSVAVELGAWKGRSTCFMGVEIANSGKPIEFHTIDHWQGSIGELDHDWDPDRREGRLFEVFLKNIEPVAAHVNIIRSDTAAAASRFADHSVDFLYVDASHTYTGVLRDLAAWYPKVKDGGLIAGDDWCLRFDGEFSVRRAVCDFFGPSASRLRLEPGSKPLEEWLQWSIVKTADQQIATRGQLRRARLRRLAADLLTARTVRYRVSHLAKRALFGSARRVRRLIRLG